ncbi:uncharacterized protein DUF2637 [Rhodococcus sp. SMB37]|uniref:DUF2637 domain-containing protein n=1 Tax=Rhodococcus sp. SMB37 TaxID=2512213 RepID=UPI0010D98477|nr:DUF2637 domain-containing protein [Rhodococcus sp. SMB37]TCN51761.1 uncharacterized protein DUF2637 [Rhodococcus sp. SMB37]
MKTLRVSPSDTVLIYGLGIAALALSYTALADLAARAGLGDWQSAVWPLVVDGLIIAATRVVVTLVDGDARRYGWVLLWSAVVVSIAGNAAHLLLPPGPVHPAVATAVAVVPPVAALAVTHLAIVRARARAHVETGGESMPENMPATVDDALMTHASAQLSVVSEEPAPPPADEADAPTDAGDALRHRARQLRTEGWSNYAIGEEIGKSEATVRRWLATAAS